jgi:hypothetical protein
MYKQGTEEIIFKGTVSGNSSIYQQIVKVILKELYYTRESTVKSSI